MDSLFNEMKMFILRPETLMIMTITIVSLGGGFLLNSVMNIGFSREETINNERVMMQHRKMFANIMPPEKTATERFRERWLNRARNILKIIKNEWQQLSKPTEGATHSRD